MSCCGFQERFRLLGSTLQSTHEAVHDESVGGLGSDQEGNDEEILISTAANSPANVLLVDRNTLSEALLRLAHVLDVQTERAIIEPVLRVSSVTRDPLLVVLRGPFKVLVHLRLPREVPKL